MDLQAFYQIIDGDYQDTLKRLYSNDLILRFVWKFQDDPSFALLRDSIAASDWGQPSAAHIRSRVWHKILALLVFTVPVQRSPNSCAAASPCVKSGCGKM